MRSPSWPDGPSPPGPEGPAEALPPPGEATEPRPASTPPGDAAEARPPGPGADGPAGAGVASGPGESGETAGAGLPAGEEAPLVLVADDDPALRELVVELLNGAGFRTVAAGDGAEAVELARVHAPAVAVLDLMMPELDGYAVLARLRGDPATREVAVVMLTGQDEALHRRLSAGVGAAAYVAKPFRPEALLEALRVALEARAERLRAAAAEPVPAPGAARALPPLDLPADPTGVAQVYGLLLAAVREGAAELAVEPGVEEVRIRFRQGGRWVERTRLARTYLAPVVARARALGGILDSTGPAHAYLRTRLDGVEVELELAVEETLHGEALRVWLWRPPLVDASRILAAAVEANASDVYLLEGTPPVLKVDGVARRLAGAPPLSAADLQKLVRQLLSEEDRRTFRATREADLSYTHPALGRFRINCYRAMGATGMVLRRVKTEVPDLETLGLPPLLADLAMERQGLILVVGATGSGKSTTLAAMIDHRNTRAPGHIVTIEDPVEFIHPRKQSVVSQREVGVDTESYLVALQKALRQAPDVILVGELRDSATVAVALHAAETGHLVLSTLHATNTTGAIERLLNFFPPEAGDAVLMQLSLMLRAIIAQRLVPRAEGGGRVAAQEILLNTPRIAAMIRRGELDGLRQAIAEGYHDGLRTLDQDLLRLWQEGRITREDALRFADSPNDLRLRMLGIR